MSDGGYVSRIAQFFNRGMVDPLVIDLSGNGIKLTPLSDSNAYFDLHDTGFAVHTGWVGSESGLLVQDNNHNGSIDNVTELFGNSSDDGFTALANLDANHDGVLDDQDASFTSLELWTDMNGNGVTDPGELHTLSSVGITSISLSAESVSQSVDGNEVREIATYTKSDGTTGEIGEAYFDNSQLDSHFTGSYQFNPAVLSLPNLRGYGLLPDLYIAMSIDPTLLQMVQALSTQSIADAANFSSQVRSILYQWAGAGNVDPTSRGSYIDARELVVLERFNGENYVASFGGGSDPLGAHQAASIQTAFDTLMMEIETRLLVQGPFAPLFPTVKYNYDTDALVGSADLSSAVAQISDSAPTGAQDAAHYWSVVAPMIGSLGASLGVNPESYTQLLQSLFDNLQLPFSVDEALTGNVLFGDGGAVRLITISSGPHYFDGGATVRSVHSEGGNDTFVFNSGYGSLEISELDLNSTDVNVLKLGPGISAASTIVTADNSGNIFVQDGTSGDRIQLDGMLSVYGTLSPSSGVQQVQFADGTTWTAQQLVQMAHQVNGTTGSDTLRGTLGGGDTFDGKGGGDVVIGNGANDTFVFNAGYGSLEINERDFNSSDVNVLKLGSDISASSIGVTGDSSGNLYITDGTSGDQIKLDGMLGGSYNGVQQVQFADGTTWSRSQLVNAATTGTAGDDTLYGSSAADVFDGKGGNDREIGNGGGDTFVFNAGYGSLEVNEFDSNSNNVNVLKLGPGISAASTIVTADNSGNIFVQDGTSGDRIQLDGMMSVYGTLSPNSGVQQVQFADGTTWSAQQLVQMAHQVNGTTGSDTLRGTLGGGDTFDGKGGGDVVIGNGANDAFVFNAGYGSLEVNEFDFNSNDVNVLKLGPGISPSSIGVTVDGSGNLYISDGISGDQIKLDGLLSGWYYGIQQVQFADGTTWSRSQLVNAGTTGTAGNDTLYGSSRADVFDGKGGNDREIGNGGGDTFVFNAGYGTLEINEFDFNSNDVNVLKLGPGISAGSTIVTADNSGNIIVQDGTSGDRIQIDGMLSVYGTLSPGFGVQQVQFADGTTWSAQQLVQMAHQVNGTTGSDTLRGTLGGGDTFDGKGGGDVVIGNGANDAFVFNAGYGSLEVNEFDFNSNDVNVLKLGPGISPSSIGVTVDGSGNLYISDGISGDQIKLDGLLSGWYYGIQQVQFADGTTWSRSQLVNAGTTGTAGNDTLYGSSRADVFDGKGGNDREIGNGGGDTFVFNAGYGTLEINEFDFNSNDVNVLKLGPGISAGSTIVTADNSGNIIVQDGTSGDRIQIDGMLSVDGTLSPSSGVQQVQFADGTTWSAQQLVQMAHQVNGTTGSDTLRGTYGGGDTFDGKGGGDVVIGNGANDTFVFNAGYGNLEVNEFDFNSNDVNVLKLGSGISPSSVDVTGDSSGNLYISDGISGDQIKLDGLLSGWYYGIQQVQFADGTTWSRSQLVNAATTGTAGDDTLYGSSAADVFDGNGGNDREIGNGGNDTYVVRASYGGLTIVNGIANNNVAQGNLVIDGANPENVWLQQVGNDLHVDLMGTTTSATIQNWFGSSYSALAELTVAGGASGNATLDTQVNQLIQAMATFSENNPGFDPTSSANPSITDPTLLAAVNTAWHHQ
ncbi:beta strand repeat-containing protein [Burkholderia ubonensis]|uniref:beta strand repeat-containing protein n=1 Tax=Burkholderia ubonensis TaxID=101571 RepID=UPI00358DEB5A